MMNIYVVIVVSFILFSGSNCFNSRNDIPECKSSLRADNYDIVIIGAGAAGCIVASKLANALQMNILLVEAGIETGNNDNTNIADPALWLNVVHNDTLEWNFQSIPQTELNNRIIGLGCAKGTGGSAMPNAMGYVRGGQKW